MRSGTNLSPQIPSFSPLSLVQPSDNFVHELSTTTEPTPDTLTSTPSFPTFNLYGHPHEDLRSLFCVPFLDRSPMVVTTP